MINEAKKRNPDILLYGLPWSYPGYLGVGCESDTPCTDDTPWHNETMTANYTTTWAVGAKEVYGHHINYLGLWNEADVIPSTYAGIL